MNNTRPQYSCISCGEPILAAETMGPCHHDGSPADSLNVRYTGRLCKKVPLAVRGRIAAMKMGGWITKTDAEAEGTP